MRQFERGRHVPGQRRRPRRQADVPVPRDDGDLERSTTSAPVGSPTPCVADGVGTGDRVAFLDRNGLEYFEVLFGGALSGAVNVAVNWRLAPAEMAAVIDDSRAQVLVVHPEFVPCLAAMESGLPSVTRVVVLGDAKVDGDLGRRVGPRPPGRVRGLAGRPTRHGPRPRGRPRRRLDAALHLGHDRAAQGRDARQPQHRVHVGAGRRGRLRDRRGHREPGGHAVVPHRRVGLGAERHVARRHLGDPARHGPGRAPAVGERRGDHPRLSRPGRVDAAPGDPGHRPERPVEPRHHLLRGLSHRRGGPRPVPRGLRVPVRAGLRDDRDHRGHRPARPRRPRPPGPSPTSPAGRGQAHRRRRAADRRSRHRGRRRNGSGG